MRFLFPQPLLAHAMDPPRGSSLPIDILVPVTVGTPPLLVELSVQRDPVHGSRPLFR